MTEDEERAAIAAYLENNKIKKLPKRSASAPPIRVIREELRKTGEATFSRGRSSRTITFKADPKSIPEPNPEFAFLNKPSYRRRRRTRKKFSG